MKLFKKGYPTHLTSCGISKSPFKPYANFTRYFKKGLKIPEVETIPTVV